jgi:hypothetical protein
MREHVYREYAIDVTDIIDGERPLRSRNSWHPSPTYNMNLQTKRIQSNPKGIPFKNSSRWLDGKDLLTI